MTGQLAYPTQGDPLLLWDQGSYGLPTLTAGHLPHIISVTHHIISAADFVKPYPLAYYCLPLSQHRVQLQKQLQS